MKHLNEPILVQIDIDLIKFNPKNPNKHSGPKFEELVKSIELNGIFNPPTVRELENGLYETIAGEGRVSAVCRLIQENKIKNRLITVLNRGVVDDETTLLFLHIDNAVRNLDFISECVGLAQLNKNGMPIRELVRQFSSDNLKSRKIWDQVGIGNFDEDILEMIRNDIEKNGRKELWNISLFRNLLPLRIEIQHHRVGDSDISLYTYEEVRIAVKEIVAGNIKDSIELEKYVIERQQKNFDRVVSSRLRAMVSDEVELVKKQLEGEYQNKIAGLKKEQKEQYEKRVEDLQRQLADFEEQKRKLTRELAKRPDKLAEKENELLIEAEELRRKRREYEEFKIKQELQIDQITARIKSEQEAVYDKKLREELDKHDNEIEEFKRNLEEYYQKKDDAKQLKVTTSFQATIAKLIQQLALLRQHELMILDPGMEKGFELITQAELLALSAQIVSTIDTSEKLQQRLHVIAQNFERSH